MNKIKNFVFVPELLSDMEYPVGNNILQNLSTMTAMANAIVNHFPPQCKIRIFCRGSSGAIIAGVIAPIVQPLEIVYCKKPGESRHSSGGCYHDDDMYFDQTIYNVIVDDFVRSGATIRSICKSAKESVTVIHALVVSGRVSDFALRDLDLDIDTLISGTNHE